MPDRFFAYRLPRHDEGAAYVAVFHKTLAVRQAQELCELRGAGAAGLGDGDHHINLAGRHLRDHAARQRLTQIQPRLIDRNAVHHRIGPGQINELKNTGLELRCVGALLGVNCARQIDKNRLAGFHVALQRVTGTFQGHRLTGQYHRARATAYAQRADAIGVAKRQHALPCDQGNHGVRALDAPVHLAYRREDRLHIQRLPPGGVLEFMRQHVEQHFGIAIGVDVAVVHGGKFRFERVGVGQVAVVHQHDAKGRVHVKRLRLFFAEGITRRRVAHLAQTAITRQRPHIAGTEHVFDHALGLVHEEFFFLLGDDPRSILAPVLQKQQGVIDQLVHGCVADNADDSAHLCNSLLFIQPACRDAGRYLENPGASQGLRPRNTVSATAAASDSAHAGSSRQGVMATTALITSSSNMPRPAPKTAPSARSTGPSPAADKALLSTNASREPATTASTKTSTNPAEKRNNSGAPAKGNQPPAVSPNHCASTKAATQLNKPSNSDAKPRHKPHTVDKPRMARNIQSVFAMAGARKLRVPAPERADPVF